MELISFNDICKFIRTALVDGCYEPRTIAKWDSVYSEGSFQDTWQGEVDNVSSLGSFLRAVVGIYNDTEDTVILYAVTAAFQASAKFNS